MVGTVGVVLSVIGLGGILWGLMLELRARRARSQHGYPVGGSGRLAYLGAMIAIVILGLVLHFGS